MRVTACSIPQSTHREIRYASGVRVLERKVQNVVAISTVNPPTHCGNQHRWISRQEMSARRTWKNDHFLVVRCWWSNQVIPGASMLRDTWPCTVYHVRIDDVGAQLSYQFAHTLDCKCCDSRVFVR